MATTVGAGGRVVLPKSVREAAGIRPGDRVSVRARAEGGRKPFDGFTTEEVMASTRSEV